MENIKVVNLNTRASLIPGVTSLEYVFDPNRVELALNINGNESAFFTGNEALIIWHRLAERELTDEEIREYLNGLVPHAFNLSFDQICIHTRKREVLEPRYFVIWWLKNNTEWSLSKIARFVGNFDHVTIRSALIKIDEFNRFNPEFRNKMSDFLVKVKEFKNIKNDTTTANTEAPAVDDAA